MKLSVEMDSEWQAAANGAIVSEIEISGGRKCVEFDTTPLISPYLWTVNFGDFQVSAFY